MNAAGRKNWPDFRRKPADYYFNRMIAGWLPRLIDDALSDQQLQAVAPGDVAATTLLLLRDMFRHGSQLLRPQMPDAAWIEDLFLEVAGGLGLPAARLRDDGQPYELEDITQCKWAKTLAAPFGIIAEKLFIAHGAIVTGAGNEFKGS